MPRYNIGIIQKRIGSVEIEANTQEEVIKIAKKRYIEKGRELPDMDDCEPLVCYATQKKCKYFVGFDGCSCNNDPDDLGECIYENGIETSNVQMVCKYFE